jgi:hypothetical protein
MTLSVLKALLSTIGPVFAQVNPDASCWEVVLRVNETDADGDVWACEAVVSLETSGKAVLTSFTGSVSLMDEIEALIK